MDETAAYLFLAALFLIVVVIALELYKVRVVQRETRKDSTAAVDSPASLCNSPDCIRCTRNREILQTALTKLSYYADDKVSNGLNDVQNVAADIKKSLNHLKNPSKYQLAEFTSAASDSSIVKSSSPVVFKLSGLREECLWSPSEFPALQVLSNFFEHINMEFIHLYKSPLSETKCLWKSNITDTGKWEIALLVDQGRVTKAAEFCPLTMDILTKIPYFMNANFFGDASFSVVHPGTDIASHCGSTNCRIRCHLGLKVPEEECILKVGDEVCHWEEGEVICFSDAFPHSVHHKGTRGSDIRAIFMLDLWHPDITDSQRKILEFAFSP